MAELKILADPKSPVITIDQSTEEDNTTSEEPPLETPYTIFNRKEKLVLVTLCTIASLLSPLTANIYYPAILDLSHEFHVSTNLINLTITVYLVFQGLAPTFIGSISDAIGRRPAYMICFVIYFVANLGLALQDSYAGLMVLRCLQSAGSSGTVTLTNAVVSDIATSSERGSYMGYSLLGSFLGQTIGPIIGGPLNQFFGWRSIFLVPSNLLRNYLPRVPFHSSRNLPCCGNGSLPPQKWNISLFTYVTRRRFLQPNRSETTGLVTERASRRKINLLGTFQIMFSKEGGWILLYTGFLFGGFYAQIATRPTLFAQSFQFKPFQISLCYIPFGVGCMLSALTTGKTLDWNFRRLGKKTNHPLTPGQQNDLSNFPIEKARLQVVIPLVFIGMATTALYGWIWYITSSLAGPLILLFFLGFSLCGAYSTFSTLLVDIFEEQAGSATAAANMARCWMGAAAVAAIGPLRDKIGSGFAMVCVAAVWFFASPLLWVVWRYGPRWREEKRMEMERRRGE
ncbi:related to dityrosine transporter [Phialocephala subalpina]|uniref:Related to dityrosine transporter n=1 Tax=Phialocephala subalpina TaxID=576137 RepID=A0A1L7X308_9HELO|nr:related to dityrosine transporter [Phialocephala subalpina]